MGRARGVLRAVRAADSGLFVPITAVRSHAAAALLPRQHPGGTALGADARIAGVLAVSALHRYAGCRITRTPASFSGCRVLGGALIVALAIWAIAAVTARRDRARGKPSSSHVDDSGLRNRDGYASFPAFGLIFHRPWTESPNDEASRIHCAAGARRRPAACARAQQPQCR